MHCTPCECWKKFLELIRIQLRYTRRWLEFMIVLEKNQRAPRKVLQSISSRRAQARHPQNCLILCPRNSKTWPSLRTQNDSQIGSRMTKSSNMKAWTGAITLLLAFVVK